ncbi:MAG: YiiD C-terminal domain-containing protein [Bdellovibrionota bacterium]|jgi:acyl-coenzyme A thioesterase PaaI-like protein|nr:YiiD C-terminal domain-containing protein [Bdellovibrionota bacterium]
MLNPRKLSLKNVARILNLYPPYLGARVKVKLIDEEEMIFKAVMPLTPLNRNYVGTHFGGSLYSMIDPFFMLILMNKLGKGYIVWDKKAEIQFKRPGKGTVEATFEIPQNRVDEIIKDVEEHGKIEPVFEVDIIDKNKKVIATAIKTLWVSKK